MNKPAKAAQIQLGQRSMKTAVSVVICALLYILAGRNPAFACIGAIFGTGSDMDGSKLSGGNRFFGTLIGGLIGMGLFRLYIWIYPDGKTRLLMLLFLVVGVLLLIILTQLFHWVGGIQPGGVVLCILLFSTPVETYLSYSINRIVDTGVGVAIALLINWLLPRERVTGWLERLHEKLEKKTEG